MAEKLKLGLAFILVISSINYQSKAATLIVQTENGTVSIVERIESVKTCNEIVDKLYGLPVTKEEKEAQAKFDEEGKEFCAGKGNVLFGQKEYRGFVCHDGKYVGSASVRSINPSDIKTAWCLP